MNPYAGQLNIYTQDKYINSLESFEINDTNVISMLKNVHLTRDNSLKEKLLKHITTFSKNNLTGELLRYFNFSSGLRNQNIKPSEDSYVNFNSESIISGENYLYLTNLNYTFYRFLVSEPNKIETIELCLENLQATPELSIRIRRTVYCNELIMLFQFNHHRDLLISMINILNKFELPLLPYVRSVYHPILRDYCLNQNFRMISSLFKIFVRAGVWESELNAQNQLEEAIEIVQQFQKSPTYPVLLANLILKAHGEKDEEEMYVYLKLCNETEELFLSVCALDVRLEKIINYYFSKLISTEESTQLSAPENTQLSAPENTQYEITYSIPGFQTFPLEIFNRVLSFLNKQELGCASKVCTFWNRFISHQSDAWKVLWIKENPDSATTAPIIEYKKAFHGEWIKKPVFIETFNRCLDQKKFAELENFLSRGIPETLVNVLLDDEGYTPLIAAAGEAEGTGKIIEVLLNLGADPFLTCSQGLQAADHALFAGNEEAKKLLSPFGGKHVKKRKRESEVNEQNFMNKVIRCTFRVLASYNREHSDKVPNKIES